MFESDLQVVYYYLSSAPKFQHTDSRRQAKVYAAAASQKRAAELFDTTPREIADFGGSTGQKAVSTLARTRPDEVLIEINSSTFIWAADLPDMTKVIKVETRDEELHGVETENSAFGMVELSRYQGDTNLFMCDYPTGHGLALVINTATLNHRHGHDHVHSKNEIIRIELSEVQWARLLSSANSGGVPCTLRRYHDPKTGMFLTPKMPNKHAADLETFNNGVKDRAKQALEDVTAVKERLRELLKRPTLRKGDLQEVLETLERAERGAIANLPYAVEVASETIHKAAENAKAEVNAHIDYAMQRLGERALGERLALAQSQGIDIGALGRGVAAMLDAPAPKEA